MYAGRGGSSPLLPWIELTRRGSRHWSLSCHPASVFGTLGGFADEFPINYNDIDLCLRVRDAGYRVIYDAQARLRHYEFQTRRGVVTFQERGRWYDRWGKLLDAGDPFYSPHLTRDSEDLSLRI